MADVSVKCEVCGKAYATYPEDYVSELESRGNVSFMCKSCYDSRNAAWVEREKQYRTPDGRQKRWQRKEIG